MSLADEFNAIQTDERKPSKPMSLADEFNAIPTEEQPSAPTASLPIPGGKPYYQQIPSPSQEDARSLFEKTIDVAEDTAEKIRGAIEAAGGTVSTAVASVPAIPYGIYNAIKNTAEGKKADTENEIFKAIHALTPDILMPHSDIGQKYMENIGTALQGVPVMAGEGAAIGAGANMAAQFGKARAGMAIAGKEPIAISPLTKASQDKGIYNTNFELHQKIANAENQGTINPTVAQRHIATEQLPAVVSEEDGRPIKMKLSEGDATQDSAIWSNERNERSMSPEMRQLIKDNAEAPPLILDEFKKQIAPNVSFSSTPEAGQYVMNKLEGVRQQLQDKTRADYQALHDAAEESGLTHTPLDANQFGKMLQERFGKQGLFHEDLPPSVDMRIRKIASGELPLTFNSFEQLRTILGREQRKASANTGEGSASAAHAIGEVRDVLENLPLTPEAQSLKPLADKARASAKLDFDMQQRSPAYKAVVEGKARPDDFVQSYIFGKNKNTGVNELQNLLNLFPDDNDFHKTLAYLRLDDIKNEASTANGRITASKLNSALAKGEDRGMDRMLFDEKILPFPINHGLENLKKAVNWTTVAPAGNYVQGNPHIIRQIGNYIGSGLGNGVTKLVNIMSPGIKAGDLLANRFQAVKQAQKANKSTEVGAGLDYNPKK